MLKFLKWFFGLFSPYVHPFERKVDKFLKHIKSSSSFADVKRGLLALMQENLIITNVWMEKKYKGYKYLDKKTRRKMYLDSEMIVKKFQEHCAANIVDASRLRRDLTAQGLPFPNGDSKMICYIAQIMSFLKPGLYYNYIQTASFGKLLRDPNVAKLEGDCNQIVTLYAYLVSLRFSLEKLQIKLLPEHVCLHFRGVDIEATNATFQRYEDDTQILPITEIISTNLLDLLDFREAVQSISPRVMVKSSQLAYAISSLKPLVAKNLNIAYRNLAISAMNAHHFETAIFFFSKTDDRKLLLSACKNATAYYLDRHDFSKAMFYASKSADRELEKMVRHNEGVYYFNNGNINKALSIFQSLGDLKMIKACYGRQYNELVKEVSTVRTLDDAKKHKSVYKKMLLIAQKMGDSTLERSVRDTLSKI